MTPSKKRNRAYTKQERRQVSFNPIDNPEDRELLEYVDQPWFNFSGTVKSLLRHHLLGEPISLNIPFVNEVKVPSKPKVEEPDREPPKQREPDQEPPQPSKQIPPKPEPVVKPAVQQAKPEQRKSQPNKPKKNVGKGMPGTF